MMLDLGNNIDDIVFYGRNKEYGAYLLRRLYPRIMIISISLSLIIIGLFFSYIQYKSAHNNNVTLYDDQKLVAFAPMGTKTQEKLIPLPQNKPEKNIPIKKTEEIIKEIPQHFEIVDTITNQILEAEISTTVNNDSIVDDSNSSTNFNLGQESESEMGSAFYMVDEMPEFPGGEFGLRAAIAKNIRYPSEAHKNNIGGTVYVRFVVKFNGLVDNVSVVQGKDSLLNKEAIRVIQELPKWKPGKQHGKAVSVWYSVPINFQIQ